MIATATAPHWSEVEWAPHIHEALINGRRLRYLDYGAGDGPPLLLIHGIGGCWQWWLQCIPELGRHTRVIAVDLPGFGGSQPLAPKAPFDRHAHALADLLTKLEIQQTIITGHSLGGLVTINLATAYPELADSVVLVCAGGIELGAARLAVIVAAFRAFDALFKNPSVVRAFSRRGRLRRGIMLGSVKEPDRFVAAHVASLVAALAAPGFVDTLIAGARDGKALDATKLDLPALLIWGERDPILPVSGARALQSKMRDARLEVIPKVGHAPMLENPHRLEALMSHFVNDRSVELALPRPA